MRGGGGDSPGRLQGVALEDGQAIDRRLIIEPMAFQRVLDSRHQLFLAMFAPRQSTLACMNWGTKVRRIVERSTESVHICPLFVPTERYLIY